MVRKRIVKQFASQPKMAEESFGWVFLGFLNCLLHVKLFCSVGCIKMESKRERGCSTILPFVFPLYVLNKGFPFLASPVLDIISLKLLLFQFDK